MTDFDSPWKEALDRFLPAFLAFFFPEVFAAIDWSRGYEALDKELQQIVREAELGPRLADKLFKVWRLDGREAWVLIHVEVQSQPDDAFGERMYVYHYRIFDRFRRPVVSLAVLGDDRAGWRPAHFGYSLWGCTVRLDFPVVKLLDYAGDSAVLEANPNPFAAVVLAHLKTGETRHDAAARWEWKVRLVKGLFERGLSAEAIRQMFRLIDWMMDLPKELQKQFAQTIHQYEEEKMKPYITSVERLAREEGFEQGREQGREQGETEGLRKGLLEGIEAGLKVRFGPPGLQLMPTLGAVQDVTALRALQQRLWTATTLDELRQLIP